MLSNRTLRKLRFCGTLLLRVLRAIKIPVCHVSGLRYLRLVSMLEPQRSKYFIIVYSAKQNSNPQNPQNFYPKPKYPIVESFASRGRAVEQSPITSELRPPPLIAQRSDPRMKTGLPLQASHKPQTLKPLKL